MSAYPPLPGIPDVVERLAAALRDEAQRVASAQERLLAVRDGAHWDSPAGRAFAAAVALLPPVLDSVAQRYAGASAALRTFAAAFRDAQQECSLALTLRERATWRRDRYAEALALAEGSESPVERTRVPELQRLMVEGAAEVLESERRWTAARARFDEADLRCSRALGALVHDALTDTPAYDTVKAGTRLADAVTSNAAYLALVPAWHGPATAVGATSAATGFLLDGIGKLAYDEGEWGPIVEELGLNAVCFAAGSLRAGALARGLPSAAHAGPVGFAGSSSRLRAGFKARARPNDPWRRRPPRRRPTRAATPVDGPAVSLPVRQRVRAAARERATRAVTAARRDWATATRNGADARAMLLTAWGLKAGAAAYTRGKQVNEAYERVEMARERWRPGHARDD